MGSYMGLKPN